MQLIAIAAGVAVIAVLGFIVTVARAAERPENNEGRSYRAKDWFTEP